MRSRGVGASVLLVLLSSSTGCFLLERGLDLGPGDVAGRAVREESGAAASFARVVPDGAGVVRRAREDGAFLVPGLAAGAYVLRLSSDEDGDGIPERAALRPVVVPLGADGLPASVLLGDVALQGTGDVRGRVVEADGAPAAGAVVLAFRRGDDLPGADAALAGRDLGVEGEARSDAQGGFRVRGLAPGAARVVALALDPDTGVVQRASAPAEVAVEAGPPTSAPDLVLAPVAPGDRRAVQVALAFEGEGADDAALEVRIVPPGASIEGVPPTVRIEGRGSPVVDVPIGRWDVHVRDADGALQGRLLDQVAYPGEEGDVLVWGVVLLAARDPCGDGADRDGDGARGLPPLSSADGRAAYEACADACGAAFGAAHAEARCRLAGEDLDCDDDGDGQPDVTEPACLGLCAGRDLDGDAICDAVDGALPCAFAEPDVDVCVFAPPPPVLDPPTDDDAGVILDAGGGDDAGAIDDGGVDAGAATETFVEDFLDTGRIDEISTTAAIDTTAPGTARAPAPFALLDPGDGSDGAFATTTSTSIRPGTHRFSSFQIGGGARVAVDGDLTLLVNGPVDVTGGSFLDVAGALTLVASGPVTLDCSIVTSVGDTTLHVTSGAAVTQGCAAFTGNVGEATFRTAAGAGASTGSMQVHTRGPITFDQNGYFFTGRNDGNGASGALVVRAYGDVTLRGDSYFFSGNAATAGTVDVRVEGTLRLEDTSYIFPGRGPVGGETFVGVGGDLAMADSYILSAEGSPLEVVVAGAAHLVGGQIYSSAAAGRAAPLRVAAGSILLEISSIAGAGGGGAEGGPLFLDAAGDVVLQSSSLFTAGAACAAGGDVVVRAGGGVALTGSDLRGGDSFAQAACGAGPGGDVVVEAGGTIALDGQSSILGGAGQPQGTATTTEQAAVSVSVDPGVLTVAVVESQGLLAPAGARFVSATVAPLPAVPVRGFLSAAGDAPYVPFADAVGTPLSDGWRYLIELRARMFDDAVVDRVEIGMSTAP